MIERAHRMGKRKEDRPRTSIIKLLNYKDKMLILSNTKKLRNSNIRIYEDFSDETNEIRRELVPKMKKARSENKYATIIYDKLIIKEFKRN